MHVDTLRIREITEIAFYRMNGFLPPGRDEPSANPSGRTLEERTAAWTQWHRLHAPAIREAVKAINELYDGE